MSVFGQRVSAGLHALNRRRLAARLSAHNNNNNHNNNMGVVLLQGAASATRFDTDHELFVRQESFFHWAFGVREPDCFGSLDVATGRATLFVPRLPQEYAVWMGRIKDLDEFRVTYEVDEVKYTDELAQAWPEKTRLLLLHGKNTDSGNFAVPASFEGIDKFEKDTTTLFDHIVELRVFKTELEQEVLSYAAKASCTAHKKVMASIHPGMLEYQAEALFRYVTHHDFGCRHQAYMPICACGPNSSTLHYGHAAAPNDRVMNDGEMVLFDMGAEYHCYCSDVTVCFPVNGRFTLDQAALYRLVLDAAQHVLREMRPGVSWLNMHRLAERRILHGLLGMGVVRGSIEELEARHVGALFMPHGLGHLIGLDTHDVGGWPGGAQRPTDPGIRKLRSGRVLAPGMCITVEPGCYFIEELLIPALKTHGDLLVEARVRQLLEGKSGVRIEDDVLVTETGCRVLSSDLPRTVEEIEAYMREHNPHVKK